MTTEILTLKNIGKFFETEELETHAFNEPQVRCLMPAKHPKTDICSADADACL